ncbi:LYR motif-containing protein 4 [Misgurnus anguillicaudatus]|uniref:LYR motif-containing protein 4 n=1 Tax=Misgurnus anguillicaudatus TaxID=75329 RepID=UPI00243612A9|nr:LYR motif-containing protein 4 [Misgurnus anguillicaudatus]
MQHEKKNTKFNMASCSRTQVISLYRMLMKESKKFPSYNYRTYALRKVKEGFRENIHVDNPKTLDMLLNQARENLAVIKRQVSIGQMYSAERTVVERDHHL